MAQMKALDAMAEERERLKRETMDGCRLFKGLEVYSADDPFYPAVVVNPKTHTHMSQIKCRQRNDRRKKYTRDVYDRELFQNPVDAYSLALKKFDEETRVYMCHPDDAQFYLDLRKEQRLELLDGMAIVINKKTPHGAQYNMQSKKFRKKRR